MSDTITVTTRKCLMCGKSSTMTLDKASYDAWQTGTLIQRAFPDMPADEREILISGTHPKCFIDLFSTDEY